MTTNWVQSCGDTLRSHVESAPNFSPKGQKKGILVHEHWVKGCAHQVLLAPAHSDCMCLTVAKQVLAKALCNGDREALKQREKCPAQLSLGAVRSHLQYSGQNKKVAHKHMGCVSQNVSGITCRKQKVAEIQIDSSLPHLLHAW